MTFFLQDVSDDNPLTPEPHAGEGRRESRRRVRPRLGPADDVNFPGPVMLQSNHRASSCSA